MFSPESVLIKIFATTEKVRDAFFDHWNTHTNRRSTIILAAIGCAALVLYLAIVRPPENFPIGELVTVGSGETLKEIASGLEKDGVVRSGFALRIVVTAMGAERGVRGGDYLFQEPKDLMTVARALSTGAYGLEPLHIRIPEGAMTRDMAAIFERWLARFDREEFLARAEPFEGYLFPDTYFFLPNASEESIVEAMRQNFDARIRGIDEQIQAFGKPLADVVTMASLLEREAHKTEDRRTIAGVLWNRLARGMLLQVDAAFRYTTGKGTFELTVDDLASDSPYNTYKYKGLPPTPIGSPSMDSLIAAITPVEHDYLYYLADRNGVTHYTKTYAEHVRNKQRYLR